MQMPRDNLSRLSPGFLMPPTRGVQPPARVNPPASRGGLTQHGTVGFESTKVNSEAVVALQEKRRRRRVTVPPMYTSVMLRILSQRQHCARIFQQAMAGFGETHAMGVPPQ